MITRRIRRVSDKRWLGLNLGIQEKWVKDKRGAHQFCSGAMLTVDKWLQKLHEEQPGEEFEVYEEEHE